MAKFQSMTSENQVRVDEKECELIRNGYRRVPALQDLQPLEYHRSDYTGTPDSFEGPKHYRIKWCEPD